MLANLCKLGLKLLAMSLIGGCATSSGVTDHTPEIARTVGPLYILPPVGSGGSDQALNAILPVLAGHRFIGLGEATHGTHEIFELKARLVEMLARSGAAKAIAFEASYGSSFAASNYVALVGDTDLQTALTSLNIPTYQTTEIADLLTALRTINSERPAAERFRLVGYDIQDPRGDIRVVERFLASIGLERLTGPAIVEFANGRGPVQAIPPAAVPGLKTELSGLRQRFIGERPAIINGSSQRAYDDHLQALDVALQALSLFDAPSQMAAYYMRDGLGAANVEWIARQVDGPVVIWAHNSHIAKDNEVPEFVTLGETLARNHRSQYFALGSAFFEGSVRALQGGQLVPVVLGPPRETSLENFLIQQGDGRDYVVDLRSAAALPAWRSQLSTPTTIRAIGVAYQPEQDERTYRPTTLSTMYDALAFVRTSTPSVPYLNRE